MAPPAPPRIDCEQQHASLAVSDVRAAADFYAQKLGFTVGFIAGDPPAIAGLNLGNVQMFLERGTPNPSGTSVYFVVGDADALHEFQRAQGVEIVVPPGDREYGLRDYRVRDLHGYQLAFGHRTACDEGPPLEIERVDVPVRLERRLAALLHDLAEHKHMSLTGCLEEILLHTCDRLGDGVPSPHTRRTLEHIQELKRKHGIDYDSHASYRFVERQKP